YKRLHNTVKFNKWSTYIATHCLSVIYHVITIKVNTTPTPKKVFPYIIYCGWNFCIFTIDKFNNPPIDMECEPNNNFDIFQLVRQFEEMILSGNEIYLDEKSLQRLMDYYVDEHEYANAEKVARE